MVDYVQDILKKSQAVCFDVDSTVIEEEGIDELAKFCNKGEEVAQLTIKAMSGSMTFQDSLKLRLDIIKPSIQQIKNFITERPPTLSPGIKELVSLLHEKNIPVFLISGGFRTVILPIAEQLNIPAENVYANKLHFDFNGDYAGFDTTQPTCANGGKAVVINNIKKKYRYKNVVLIGDGATDLEASPPADAFIGYGGNVIRPLVQARAKWFVTDFKEIIDVLKS